MSTRPPCPRGKTIMQASPPCARPSSLSSRQPRHCNPPLASFLVLRQSRQALASKSEAPCEFFYVHIHQPPRHILLRLPLALVPLKRKPLARGTRAPRVPSIVDGFCQLPSPESAG